MTDLFITFAIDTELEPELCKGREAEEDMWDCNTILPIEIRGPYFE